MGVLALIHANKGESKIAVPDCVYVNEQKITQKTKTWKQKNYVIFFPIVLGCQLTFMLSLKLCCSLKASKRSR